MATNIIISSLLVFYYITTSFATLIIKKPSNGTGSIEISTEQIEHYYYNPDRLLFVFNRSCVKTLNRSDNIDKIQNNINHIRSTYAKCLNITENSMKTTHYDTQLYSYVFFDLLCSMVSIKNISINYNELCIEYIIYEPLFNISFETVPPIIPEFACMKQNTDWIKSFGLDLLQHEYISSTYSYPQYTNDTIANHKKIDIHIVDSGIQSDHTEFHSYQVIHKMGDGPAKFENTYGDHGTHVAGLAAGKNYGSSRNFTIYDYRVCEFTSDGKEMPCYGSLIFEALLMVYTTVKNSGKPTVINLSLGGPKTTPFEDAYNFYFEELNSVGAISIVAAGNENVDACTTSPAYSNNAITAGSYNKYKEKSDFSNWGNCVDVWAPGSTIYSAVASDRNDKYEYKSGTSMASPYITGVVADLLYINPSLNFNEIKEILIYNSHAVSGGKCDSEYECKRVQFNCESYSSIVYELPYQLTTLDIVAISMGCVVFVFLVGMIIICCIRKKRQNRNINQSY